MLIGHDDQQVLISHCNHSDPKVLIKDPFASFAFDVSRFDDGPPFLDLGLLQRPESLGRLLVARGDFLHNIGVTLMQSCAPERIHHCRIDL